MVAKLTQKNSGKKTMTARTKLTGKRKATKNQANKLAGKSTNKIAGKPSVKSAGKAAQKNGQADKTKLSSREDAHDMMGLLCKTYPDADCELTFVSDFQLLIAVILSAQCTDVTVNKVTPILFTRFPTARDLAEASLDEIKEIIRPTGFFNAKAQNIQACASALVIKFGGKVPENLEDLTKLPGVGRKTANVVLGVAHGQPGWTVDTHVQRLSKRLGLTEQDDPYKIELDLQKLYPGEDWSKLSITLIWHGRRCCFARKPNCAGCPINQLCPASLI
jgi:endonuclease-3